MCAVALEADVWTNYFQALTRDGGEILATVTLLPEQDTTDASQAGRRLRAISYDADRDVLELGVGGDTDDSPALRFFISAPRRITVEESRGEKGIVIEDAGGARTAIGLRSVGEGS